MKNIIQLSLLSLAFTIVSCGEKEQSLEEVITSNDVELMRKKRSNLTAQQRELNASIKKLTTKIESFEDSNAFALVEVEKLEPTIFKHFVEVQGDVQTDENILVYPEFNGVLEKIYVQEGDQVAKGQLLATIDDGGLSVELKQLKSELKLAKTRFERQSKLWEQNIGSEIQYLEAETSYNSLTENLNRLKERLAKTNIRAPFSGKIDQKLTEQGELVSPGMSPVFRLINLDKMYINAELPEQYLNSVNLGTSVTVKLQALGEEFDAQVNQVSSFINPENRKFSLKIDIPSTLNSVKPNLVAKIKINDYISENTYVVNQSVLQETANGDQIAYVFEADTDSTGVAKKVQIQTGKAFDGKTEVKSGLKEYQYLITSGARAVRDGEKLRLKSPLN